MQKEEVKTSDMDIVEKEIMVDSDVEYKDKIVIEVSPMKLSKYKEWWGYINMSKFAKNYVIDRLSKTGIDLDGDVVGNLFVHCIDKIIIVVKPMNYLNI